MTIIHFALSKFKPDVDAATKAVVFQKVGELTKQLSIPGLIRVTAGPPVDPTYAGGYEFALTAEFEDIKGFQAYLPHPDHIKLLRLTKGYTDASSLISFQIDTSKKVASKL